MKQNMPDESRVKTEEVGCVLCNSERHEPILFSSDIRQRCKRAYTLVKCRDCGFVYLNPRPTPNSILEYYMTFKPENSKRRPLLYERFYYKFFRDIPLKKKGALLDVGCGNGGYLCQLKEKGWRVAGVDIANADYVRNELGLDVHEGSLLDANLESDSFDAVTFWWTLEHMYQPIAMLKEAHRVLKNDGIVVVGVPNIDSWEAKVFRRYWFHLLLPMHLYQFSRDSLIKCLNKAGFKKVIIRHDLFSFGSIGSLQCILNDKGIDVSFTNPFWYALSLSIDMLLGLMGKSGLITAYAFKK